MDDNFSPSPSTCFSEVVRILKNRSPAIRNEEDLLAIRNLFNPTLSASDIVWAALSHKQKLVLCKYFVFKTVYEDEGQMACVERRDAVVVSKKESSYGIFILIKGRATISITDGPSLLVDSGGDSSQLGHVLGRLSIQSDDANDFFKHDATTSCEGGNISMYNQFMSNRRGNGVIVRFEKGSTYTFLPETQSRQFLDRLSASLTAKRVLNDVGIMNLLSKQTHENGCSNDSLLDGENKATKVFQIKAGQILIKEGDSVDKVVFIAKGSCFILRSNRENEVHCVGSLIAPCFVGITALFDNVKSGGLQPVSVMAATNGCAFSFCSLCFLTSVDRASVTNAFRDLAKCQLAAWSIRHHAIENEEVGALPAPRDCSKVIRPRVKAKQQPLPVNIELLTGQSTKENSINMDESSESIQSSIDINALYKGKLNRSKFLSAIHETMSIDLKEERTIENDVVGGRDTLGLIDWDKSNALADIISALSENCVQVDVPTCEGTNPFHNFTINSVASVSNEDGLQMLLQMPFSLQSTSRLRHMADKCCLGRKRPPEYDDSDPLLMPTPSVVSRKMHGKTLPVVRQIKCDAG